MEFLSTPIVQVAFSVVICWALFSVFCSLIHEGIARVKSERGRYHRTQLQDKLADLPNDINWGALLYRNPRIVLLTRAYNMPPSEIAPRVFAESLIETIANSHLAQTNKALQAAAVSEGRQEVSPQAYQSDILSRFSFAVDNLMPSDVIALMKNSLASAKLSGVSDEKAIYNELVSSIENWYIELTKRVSVWYDKKTRLRIFILGSVVATLLNVDSIELFKFFMESPKARAEVIDFYEKNVEKLEAMSSSKFKLEVKDSSSKSEQDSQKVIAKSNNKNERTENITYYLIRDENPQKIDSGIIKVRIDISSLTQQLDTLTKAAELPIGLNHFASNTSNSCPICFWILKIIGILISAFAASAGAPFWFNYLRQFTQKPTLKP